MSFREDVADAIGEPVSPAQPSAFLRALVTVTKRTLSIGPFILRETDRSADLGWDEDDAGN